MVREGRERGGGSEKDVLRGVVVLESLPPRVATEMEGGRSGRVLPLPLPFSISSHLSGRSLALLLTPTGTRLRMSAAPSWLLISSTRLSPLAIKDSLVAVLTSTTLRPARPGTFSISVVVPYTPIPLGALLEVDEEGRLRASGSIDWVEFRRPLEGWARGMIAGAGLL